MALYNELRPNTFDGMIGQTGIVENIRKQSISNNFFNTYIFSGQYGSGKTTMARILAMAINCKHKDENGNPCLVCEECKSILNKTALDVVEIDGASNTGVDKVRELIADTNFKPVSLQKKVYIIDEVHMLSTGAFNALLKTLEEPPETCVFILATTELRKIPATVCSRSACYSFTSITRSDIADHLMSVCNKYNTAYEPDAISLIARRSDGSMRNALSLLEQCMKGGDIVKSNVEDVLNVVSIDSMIELLNVLLVTKNKEKMVEIVDGMMESGDVVAIVSDIIEIISDSMLLSMNALPTDDYANSIKDIAGMPGNQLVLVSELFLRLLEKLKAGANKSIVLLELFSFLSRQDELISLREKVEKLSQMVSHNNFMSDSKEELITAVPEPETKVSEASEVSEVSEEPEEMVEAAVADTVTDTEDSAKEDMGEKEDVNVSDESDGLFDFFDFGFNFGESEKEPSMEGPVEEPKEEVKEPVKEKTVAAAPCPVNDNIAEDEDNLSEVEEGIKKACQRDKNFEGMLNTGCVKTVVDGKIVYKTPHMPIESIVKACIEAYGLDGVEVVLDENIRL